MLVLNPSKDYIAAEGILAVISGDKCQSGEFKELSMHCKNGNLIKKANENERVFIHQTKK